MPHLRNFWAPDASPLADGWASVRRPSRHTDEALTGTARLWLRKLPAGRRPQHLCVQFPRVANQLAWVWRDAAMAQVLLDDLLIDRRGGRAGFPKAVVIELRRLRALCTREEPVDAPVGCFSALRHLLSRH